MRILSSKVEMKALVRRVRAAGRSLGLVPTMGALHEGHLSLVRLAKRQCDAVVVSVFVNPVQFGPQEDLTRYPRNLEKDAELLSPYNLDAIFAPNVEEMYPEGFQTYVAPGELAACFEGKARPEHFRGVTTVVLKLLNIVTPDLAYFGQKDFQQALVIRRLVEDLNLEVHLVVCPIVRDADGLAISSRNIYLSSEERQAALSLSRSLRRAQELLHSGEIKTHQLLAEMKRVLAQEPQLVLDYLAIVEPYTLRPVERVALGCVALVAAKVGKTRLIDNLILGPPGASLEQLLHSALSAVIELDTRTRVPGLEAEILRQRVENCRDCAAIPAIVLPPRQFLLKSLKEQYTDLNTVEVAVIGRDAPLHLENYLYADDATRNPFVTGLFQLLGVKDLREFRTRFVLTDAIRCHSSHIPVPEKAMQNCARHLQAELSLFPNLKTIVVLGEDAYGQFQRLAGKQAPGQIIPFSERVREKGWACEEVVLSWLGDRRLRVFYCYHPAMGYLRSPSIGPMLTPPASGSVPVEG